MKQILVIGLLALVTLVGNAQQRRDIIYLKNGSVIKGVVTKRAPSASLLITTDNGSVFLCDTSKVVTITDEIIPTPSLYRWFVDMGYSIMTEDYSGYVLSTTHGFQLSRKLFCGAGLSLHYSPGNDRVSFPLFFNIRYDFVTSKLAPFVDCKFGGFFGKDFGYYVSSSIGLRFNLKQKKTFYISLGFTVSPTAGLPLRCGLSF